MKVARIMKLGKLGFIFDMLSDFFNISPKAGPVPLRVRPPMSVHLHSAATTRVTGFRDLGRTDSTVLHTDPTPKYAQDSKTRAQTLLDLTRVLT